MSSLQEKLRAEGADAEDILKKIYELAKRGQ
jgi:hypothetical protein